MDCANFRLHPHLSGLRAPLGIHLLALYANILENSKSWGQGVQPGPRLQVRSLRETPDSLWLCISSAVLLDGVRPPSQARHVDAADSEQSEYNQERGRHKGTLVPGVKSEGSEVRCLGLV